MPAYKEAAESCGKLKRATESCKRFLLPCAFFSFLLLLGSVPVFSKAPALLGEDVRFATRDGWQLSGRFVGPADTQKNKTFVLLHMIGGRKEDWAPWVRRLATRGYGALAFDFRGHGESRLAPDGAATHWRKFVVTKSYNEWNNMIEDVGAAVEFLKQKGVSTSSMVFCGAEVGSSIALKYAATHPEIPMTILISPGLSYREVLTVNGMRRYGRRPILFLVGGDDTRSLLATKLLYDIAKYSSGPENAMRIEAEKGHGIKMLTPELIQRVLAWVENPVAPPEPLPEASTAPVQGIAPSESGGKGESSGACAASENCGPEVPPSNSR